MTSAVPAGMDVGIGPNLPKLSVASLSELCDAWRTSTEGKPVDVSRHAGEDKSADIISAEYDEEEDSQWWSPTSSTPLRSVASFRSMTTVGPDEGELPRLNDGLSFPTAATGRILPQFGVWNERGSAMSSAPSNSDMSDFVKGGGCKVGRGGPRGPPPSLTSEVGYFALKKERHAGQHRRPIRAQQRPALAAKPVLTQPMIKSLSLQAEMDVRKVEQGADLGASRGAEKVIDLGASLSSCKGDKEAGSQMSLAASVTIEESSSHGTPKSQSKAIPKARRVAKSSSTVHSNSTPLKSTRSRELRVAMARSSRGLVLGPGLRTASLGVPHQQGRGGVGGSTSAIATSAKGRRREAERKTFVREAMRFSASCEAGRFQEVGGVAAKGEGKQGICEGSITATDSGESGAMLCGGAETHSHLNSSDLMDLEDSRKVQHAERGPLELRSKSQEPRFALAKVGKLRVLKEGSQEASQSTKPVVALRGPSLGNAPIRSLVLLPPTTSNSFQIVDKTPVRRTLVTLPTLAASTGAVEVGLHGSKGKLLGSVPVTKSKIGDKESASCQMDVGVPRGDQSLESSVADLADSCHGTLDVGEASTGGADEVLGVRGGPGLPASTCLPHRLTGVAALWGTEVDVEPSQQKPKAAAGVDSPLLAEEPSKKGTAGVHESVADSEPVGEVLTDAGAFTSTERELLSQPSHGVELSQKGEASLGKGLTEGGTLEVGRAENHSQQGPSDECCDEEFLDKGSSRGGSSEAGVSADGASLEGPSVEGENSSRTGFLSDCGSGSSDPALGEGGGSPASVLEPPSSLPPSSLKPWKPTRVKVLEPEIVPCAEEASRATLAAKSGKDLNEELSVEKTNPAGGKGTPGARRSGLSLSLLGRSVAPAKSVPDWYSSKPRTPGTQGSQPSAPKSPRFQDRSKAELQAQSMTPRAGRRTGTPGRERNSGTPKRMGASLTSQTRSMTVPTPVKEEGSFRDAAPGTCERHCTLRSAASKDSASPFVQASVQGCLRYETNPDATSIFSVSTTARHRQQGSEQAPSVDILTLAWTKTADGSQQLVTSVGKKLEGAMKRLILGKDY